MLTRSKVRLLEIGMDYLSHCLIGGSGCSRGHMRDEMRGVFLARLGEVDFVARPPRLALFAIASVLIIRRVDELLTWRKILIAAKAELALDPDIVLQPDAAQDLDGRDLTQKRRGRRLIHIRQQL